MVSKFVYFMPLCSSLFPINGEQDAYHSWVVFFTTELPLVPLSVLPFANIFMEEVHTMRTDALKIIAKTMGLIDQFPFVRPETKSSIWGF